MLETKCFLTTFDNPFDPFDQFDDWFRFDNENGHKCCEMLGRFARTSDEFSEKENNDEIERAIDEIIKYDFIHKYKKIKREVTFS